jgi:O-antigen ligase
MVGHSSIALRKALSTRDFNEPSLATSDWLCLFFFAWFISFADQYWYTIGGPLPLYSQIAAIAIFGLVGINRLVQRSKRNLSTRFRLTILGVGVYFAWLLMAALYSSANDLGIDILIQRIKVCFLILLAALSLEKIIFHKFFYFLCAILAIAGAVVNIYDFFIPTFSLVPGRAAGLYLNPNGSGLMLISLAIIATRPLSPAVRYVMWGIVAAGVLLTFSRSSWICLLFALVYLTWLGDFGLGRMRIILALCVVFVAGVIVSLFVSGAIYHYTIDSQIGQYLDHNTVERIGGSGTLLTDDSSSERQRVFFLGLEAFLAAPLFGHGLGYTYEWSADVGTHNMFVMMLAEGGVLGLSVYLLLLATLCYQTPNRFRPLAGVILIVSLFSHNLLDGFAEGFLLATLAAAPIKRAENSKGYSVLTLRV